MSMVHLNAAGASIRSAATNEIVREWLEAEGVLGAYELSGHRRDDLSRPYRELASLLGCLPDDISIVTSATEAWNEIVHGLAWTFKAGDGIATSITEYGSNYLTYLQLRRRFGIEIHVIGETEEGDIDVEALELVICSKKIRLISLPHVPTNSGRVYDVVKVGNLAKKYSVLFLLDACQSVGQLELDISTVGCDLLTGTSRKYLRGPRGVGFLYCSKRCKQLFEPATIDVRSAVLKNRDEYIVSKGSERFEKFEVSYASKAGLGVAVAELNKLGIANVESRILELSGYLREQLRQIDGVSVEDRGKRLCGIVSFSRVSSEEHSAEEQTEALFECLTARGYSVSLSKWTSTLIDMTLRGLRSVIRVSPHVYNTVEELDGFIHSVRQLVSNFQ